MEPGKRNLLTDNEFREKVALRAYEIYEDRGGQHGSDIEDWLQAETDVLTDAAQRQKMSPGRIQPSGARSAVASPPARKPDKSQGSSG